ncbi:VRR-NUC domain-containing protein [Clostridium butyricum]|uniref:VRR-NUC domain-containing protein n=1 Tax=Clostridium butyricum TaxID=1492 RepID=UPI00374E6668
MREKDIEQKLVKSVKAEGGMCIKFTSPGMDGVPDRLVLMPERKIAFIELKAPGKKPRPLQIKRMKQLKALGFLCFVLDDTERIGGILDEITNQM